MNMAIPNSITKAVEKLQDTHFTGSLTLHFADGAFKLAEEKRSWRPDGEGIDNSRPTNVASA